MAHPANITEARAMIAPFVGARLNRSRNADGYLIPRTAFVDIYAPGVVFVDADVRAVSDEGIEVSRMGGFTEVVRWSDVEEIRFSGEGRPDRVFYFGYDEPEGRPAESYIAMGAAA